MQSLINIRKKMRSQRRALTSQERKSYANEFAHIVSGSRVFANAKRIAFYFANDGEVDLLPLIEIAWRMKKQCFVPVLLAPFVNKLMFAKYSANTELGVNKFGIAEPMVAAQNRVRARELDLVFTPLVAFDGKGNRVGMGGGYYDRTFSFLQTRQVWRKPVLVGVAYPFQEVKKIPCNSWDVPLSMICTGEKIVYC